jgi:hypothetical protein
VAPGVLFANDFPVTMAPNEPETEARLIYPIADLIGWTHRQVQQALEGARRNVPDALLFLNEEDRRSADHEATQEGRIKHADAILEAKRWNLPFDRRVDRETPPMAQLLAYLSRAEVQSNRRVRWGILTDGRKWRLAFQGAPSMLTDFLEIDLGVLLEIEGIEPDLFSPPPEDREHWLKVFLLMFGADAFSASVGRQSPPTESRMILMLSSTRQYTVTWSTKSYGWLWRCFRLAATNPSRNGSRNQGPKPIGVVTRSLLSSSPLK